MSATFLWPLVERVGYLVKRCYLLIYMFKFLILPSALKCKIWIKPRNVRATKLDSCHIIAELYADYIKDHHMKPTLNILACHLTQYSLHLPNYQN